MIDSPEYGRTTDREIHGIYTRIWSGVKQYKKLSGIKGGRITSANINRTF